MRTWCVLKIASTTNMTISEISTYVRDEWSGHGVEVQAAGVRSLTLLLPPDLRFLTELCVELWTHFGASTDFKHTQDGSTLTVWLPTARADATRTHSLGLAPYVPIGCMLAVSAGVAMFLTEERYTQFINAVSANLF